MSCSQESSGPPVDFINSLDDLCLDKILGYLSPLEIPKVGEVCKRWRKMSQNAWHNIKIIDDYNIPYDVSTQKMERLLLHCGRYLTDLSYYESFTKSIIPVIRRNCLNLEILTLHLEESCERDFLGAFQYMEKLKFLDIFIENYTETDGTWPDRVSARILESVPAGIESISFQEGSLEGEPILLILTDLPVLLERLNNLSSLTIKHCRLDSNALAAILQKTKLDCLDFDHCHLATTTSFESNLVNLQHLRLDQSKNVDGIVYSSAVTSQNLESLDLKDCNVSKCGADIAKFKNLKSLTLDNVKRLGNTNFVKITTECQKIQHLTLRDTKNISSTALETIGLLKNLKYLDLPKKNVDDQVIVSVANQCTNLTNLSFGTLDDSVTVASFKELGKLVNLKSLSFAENDIVNDTVIINIASNCSKLESLSLYGAKHVTDSSITILIKMCNCLSNLTVYDSQITVASLLCAAEKTKLRQKELRLSGFSHKIEKVFSKLNIESPLLKLSARYSYF